MPYCKACVKDYGLDKRGNLKTPKHFGSPPAGRVILDIMSFLELITMSSGGCRDEK